MVDTELFYSYKSNAVKLFTLYVWHYTVVEMMPYVFP